MDEFSRGFTMCSDQLRQFIVNSVGIDDVTDSEGTKSAWVVAVEEIARLRRELWDFSQREHLWNDSKLQESNQKWFAEAAKQATRAWAWRNIHEALEEWYTAPGTMVDAAIEQREALRAERDAYRRWYLDLVALVRQRLMVEGHHPTCRFTGCTCGQVPLAAEARMNLSRALNFF